MSLFRVQNELYRRWDVVDGVLDLVHSVLVQRLDVVELQSGQRLAWQLGQARQPTAPLGFPAMAPIM
jgi:hypothetical protein